jgi:hypothetical protein
MPNSLKRQKRVLEERRKKKAIITMIQKFFWGRERKKLRLTEEQRAINAMTSWQNSQWLRGGADPAAAHIFLSMKRSSR